MALCFRYESTEIFFYIHFIFSISILYFFSGSFKIYGRRILRFSFFARNYQASVFELPHVKRFRLDYNGRNRADRKRRRHNYRKKRPRCRTSGKIIILANAALSREIKNFHGKSMAPIGTTVLTPQPPTVKTTARSGKAAAIIPAFPPAHVLKPTALKRRSNRRLVFRRTWRLI